MYNNHLCRAKLNLKLLLSGSGLCQHCRAWCAPNTEKNQGVQLHTEFCNTGQCIILISFRSVPVPALIKSSCVLSTTATLNNTCHPNGKCTQSGTPDKKFLKKYP